MEDEVGEPLRKIVERYDELECLRIVHDGKERKLVLSKAVIPSEVILHIPPKALLNTNTIGQYLSQDLLPSTSRPSHASNWKNVKVEDNEARLPLTSVQTLTLLLAAWRSLYSNTITYPASDLDEILSTLPRSYSTFPLVWKVTSEQVSDHVLASYYKALLDALPSHVNHLCNEVYQRYINDCAAIQSIERNAQHLYTFQSVKIGPLKQVDLLWAWCSVNSRCVYLPLGLKPSKENFTMVPLLDMANHTMQPHLECKVKWTPSGGLQLSAPAKTYGPKGLAKDQEVMIAYGAHSNGTLLSEYGFTLCRTLEELSDDGSWTGNPFAEVNVGDIIDQFLARDKQYGLQKEQMLREAGYYGDYTIHPHPKPAHISFRLVVVLRLLVIADISMKEETKAWHQTISGDREQISVQNESASRDLLKTICDQVIKDRSRRREKLLAETTTLPSSLDLRDLHFNFSMIQRLLEEESRIATLIKEAVDRGHPMY